MPFQLAQKKFDRSRFHAEHSLPKRRYSWFIGFVRQEGKERQGKSHSFANRRAETNAITKITRRPTGMALPSLIAAALAKTVPTTQLICVPSVIISRKPMA